MRCTIKMICSERLHLLFHGQRANAAKLLQSWLTLCDPIDGSPPGSPVPGILQARTLEWVAISFSMHESENWKWSRSVVSDSATPGTAAHQDPPSMGFSRKEYQKLLLLSPSLLGEKWSREIKWIANYTIDLEKPHPKKGFLMPKLINH